MTVTGHFVPWSENFERSNNSKKKTGHFRITNGISKPRHVFVFIVNTVKFQNKPRGLYFSKALFEGFIFGGAYIRRGLSTEGSLRFKIDWTSLIV